MWRAYGKPGGAREGYVDRPYTIADAEATLAEVSGDRAFARDFFARYIQGHDVADYARLLARAGFVVRKRSAGRAWLGDLVDLGNLQLASLVAPSWPIYAAGVDQDDELQRVDGQKLQSLGDLTAILRRHKPGDRIDVVFVDRTGQTRKASVTLAEDPHVEVVPIESAGGSLQPDRRPEILSRSLARAPELGPELDMVPWLQIVDAVLGVANFARGRGPRRPRLQGRSRLGRPGHLETRLAGVMVAALKEVFDRDSRRLELEREQMELERQRAERALKLELLRQAGDREIGRLRLVAGVAVAAWIGTLFFAPWTAGGTVGARIALGIGWALLLAALACAFAGQSRVSAALGRIDGTTWRKASHRPGVAGALAPWLIVAGLAVRGAIAVLVAFG